MLRMNLLPFEQGKRVKLGIFYQKIFSSGLVLILLILILILFLGGGLIFLNYQYQTITRQITIEQSRIIQTETVKGMEGKVGELNNELLDLRKIERERSNLYQVLDNISRSLLDEVKVNTLEIDRQSKKITVSGHALTRENLLKIKQILETESSYKDINFPLSNLANPIDIDFYFSFTYEY